MSIFIIAEVGQAHDGSLGILHSYIDAAAEAGADAVKFQTHIAEAESSQFEPFRVNFSYEDETRFDYWKRMEFTKEQWMGISQHCDEVGIEFISSPFSIAAVELLEEVGVSRYKIGSGEVSNHLLLDAICRTGKEVILSSGMSSYDELAESVSFIKNYGNKLSVLQCTTKYPTQPEDIGLNCIHEISERFLVDSGLSDHSGTIYPAIAASALGAKMIEAHIVFDKSMFGPDASSSLTVSQFKQMVEGVRATSAMLENPVEKGKENFENLKTTFGKSLALNRCLAAGDIIELSHLESKKPGDKGIHAKEYLNVIGKRVKHKMNKWDFLNYGDINE